MTYFIAQYTLNAYFGSLMHFCML